MNALPDIVLIHGFQATAQCWEPYKEFFESRGFRVTAPDLPGRNGVPLPDGLKPGRVSLRHYAEYCAGVLRTFESPPVVIGHSMGALLAQMLAERNLIRAAALAAPSAPRGIFMASLSGFWAFKRMLLTPCFWRRQVKMTFSEAVYGLYQRVAPHKRREYYDSLVADSGRILFEMTFWALDRHKTSRVDQRRVTAPLLVVAGGKDKLILPRMARAIAKKYPTAQYVECADLTHYLIGEEGWEESAERIYRWIDSPAVSER
jgi:pimeloyl-ACP methyl ester carboxylesterase